MPYIGNNHIAGDHTNNFKVLDDISSFTATFDGSATSVVDTTNNTIRAVEHRFIQGQRVTYTNGGGGNIGGLTSGTAYFVIFDSASTIKLATNATNAANSTAINLSSVGSGSSHTLNVAFDGVNKKFKLTHSTGTAARLNNASQISIAINNVVQRPNLDPNNYTDGFALEDHHKIVFKTAPTDEDVFWGSIISNTLPTFDISDHKVDTFTGDGSTTEFNLSHTPANNESLMVSINGVLQHPSDGHNARSYTLIANVVQFTAAPAVGDEIQVRHMGFAGATTGDVSGFYGRTGNVVLGSTDHITTGDITSRNINSSGILTASSASFGGNVSIGGTLTYEDVTNIDSVGLVTARDGIFIPDNKKLEIGNAAGSGDLQLYHDGGHSRIKDNGTGNLVIQTDGFRLRSTDETEVLMMASKNNSVDLYYDNVKKFETSAKGIKVGTGVTIETSGQAEIAGITTFYKDVHIKSGTNRLYLGSNDRLSLIADPSHSYLRNAGSGSHFQIHSDNFSIRSHQGNGSITLFYSPITDGNEGGGPRLYHNHGAGIILERLRTTKSGVNITGVTTTTGLAVTGVSTFTGAIDANGDLDVDGHTNLDNVSIAGVTTCSDQLNMLDNKIIRLGSAAASRTSIYYDSSGSNTWIKNFNDTLKIGYRPVEIYYVNQKRLEFINGGNRFTTDVSTTFLGDNYHASWNPSSNRFQINDNAKLAFGSQADTQFFHNSANLYLQNSTGHVYIQNNVNADVNKNIYLQAKNGENSITCENDGEVYLFSNQVSPNQQKLRTSNTGIYVTGIGTFTNGLSIIGSQNSQLTNNQLIFDRAGTSYIDNINDAGALSFRIGSSYGVGLLIDSSTVSTPKKVEISGSSFDEGAVLTLRNTSAINNDENIANINVAANDGPSGFHTGAQIKFQSGNNWSDGATYTDIVFKHTKVNSTSLVEALKIAGTTTNVSSHVSIGSSNLSNQGYYYLAIKGYERYSQGAYGDAVNIGIFNQSGAVEATAGMDFRLGQAAVSNTTAVRLLGGKQGGWTNTASTRDGYFKISVSANAQLIDRFTIRSNGNVGIGTMLPSAPLQIDDDSPKILLKDTDNNADISIHNVGGAAVYSSNGDTVFQTADTDEKFRIASGGVISGKYPFIFGSFGSVSSTQGCRITGQQGNHPAALSLDGGSSPTLEIGSKTGETIIGTNSYGNSPTRFKTGMNIATLTGGTTRVTIAYNGRVGVGIDDPQNYFSSYNNLVVGNASDTGGITIVSSNSSGGSIAFADGNSGNQAYRGLIRYAHSNDSMAFHTNVPDVPSMLFDQNNRVGINTNGTIYGKLQVDAGSSVNADDEYYGQDFAITVRSSEGPNPNDEGTGICFVQKWYTGSTDLVRTGAIVGYKSAGNGGFGGGLIFKTQENGANPMSEKLRIDASGKIAVAAGGHVGFATDSNTYIEQDGLDRISFVVGGVRTISMVEASNMPVLVIDKNGTNTHGTQGAGYYANPHANDLVIGNVSSGNHGMTICTPSSGHGNINFSDGNQNAGHDSYRGSVGYNHSTEQMIVRAKSGAVILKNNATDTLVATSSGKVGIGTISPVEKFEVNGSINAGGDNSPVFQIRNEQGSHIRSFKHYFDCAKGNISGTAVNRVLVDITIDESFHQAGFEITYFTRLQAVSDSHVRPNKIIFGVNRFNSANSVNVTKTVVEQHSEAASHCDVNIVSVSGTNYQLQIQFSTTPNVSSAAGGWVEGATVYGARFADIDYYFGART